MKSADMPIVAMGRKVQKSLDRHDIKYIPIVHPAARGSIFAVLIALEGAAGAFGAPIVGYLAEKTFGYVRTEAPINLMPQEIREENLKAIGGAATVVMVVPWSTCFLIYGIIYFTYPTDRRNKSSKYSHND